MTSLQVEIPRSTYFENEDWTSQFHVNSPADVALVASDIATIEARVYEKGSGASLDEALDPLLEVTGIVPGDHVAHPYSDPDVLGAVRTEGWTRNPTGYNFLYVVELSALSPAARITAGKKFNIVFFLKGDTGKWGDMTLVHEINIASGALA